MVRKILLIVALVVVVFSLIGCQAIQGLGRDIEWIGKRSEEILRPRWPLSPPHTSAARLVQCGGENKRFK